MPLSSAPAHSARIDPSSVRNDTERRNAPGAGTLAAHLSLLSPEQIRRTSSRSGNLLLASAESGSDVRMMGGAVGGLNGIGSIGGRESRTMTLTVDERGERAALRGSTGTLHLPGVPHALSRAYTAPDVSSPANPISGEGAGDTAGGAAEADVDLDAVVRARSTTTTPAPAHASLMRLPPGPSAALDPLRSLPPVIVASPTHAHSGSPATARAGDAGTADSTSAGGLPFDGPGPFSPDGTYTLPSFHLLAATVGVERYPSAGNNFGGSVSGSSLAQPFAAGTGQPDLLPPESGSGSGSFASQDHALAPWEAGVIGPKESVWATVAPFTGTQAQATFGAEVSYAGAGLDASDRDGHINVRRGGRMLRIDGWAPSHPSSSTPAFSFSNELQTPGAGPGPSSMRNARPRGLGHGNEHSNSYSMSGSFSGSVSPGSAASGTPPQTGYGLGYSRFAGDVHSTVAGTEAHSVPGATAYVLPYSETSSALSFGMRGHSHSHSQSLSPFATAASPPGAYAHTHSSAMDTSVPSNGSGSHGHVGTDALSGSSSFRAPLYGTRRDISPGHSPFAVHGGVAGFPHSYAFAPRDIAPPSVAETSFGPEANAQISAISNANTFSSGADAAAHSSSPFRSLTSHPYASLSYRQSLPHTHAHATLQSLATISGRSGSPFPLSLPAPASEERHDAAPSASRSQAPPMTASAGSAAEEGRLPVQPYSQPNPQVQTQTHVVRLQTPKPQTRPTPQPGPSSQPRKRVHPCWMCHKSFDRPSTLRKHLLVHTGEKAFACKICGRRFGVQSNLNRHERKCATKPVHNKAAIAASTVASGSANSGAADDQASPSPAVPHSASAPHLVGASGSPSKAAVADSEEAMARETTNPAHRPIRGRRAPAQRIRTQSAPDVRPREGDGDAAADAQAQDEGTLEGSAAYELQPILSNVSTGTSSSRSSSGAGSTSVATATTLATTPGVEGERRAKRRRRAPSPSRWVPASLRGFSLAPCRMQALAPLPPVRPGWDERAGCYEERDSFAGPPPPSPDEEGDEENVDPALAAASTSGGDASSAGSGSGNTSPTGISSAVGTGLTVRQRNFEYAPYHPCGWTGRLPGPAADITNYRYVSAGVSGSGSSGSASGGGGLTFEFSLSAPV